MTQYLILLIAALLVCAIGFDYYIHFISLGYGFSVAAEGLLILILFCRKLNLFTALIGIAFIVYGLRLGLFLLNREKRTASYNEKMEGNIKTDASFKGKYAIWVSCAVLYTFQVSPYFFRMLNAADSRIDFCTVLGLLIMILGIAVEGLADFQKSRAKKEDPNTFVSTGLYKYVRCPNYFGELLTWTGVFISGFGAVRGLQWIPALIGWLGIVYIMFGGARRLEIRQNKSYGEDPAYQEYTASVPIILPKVPLYSVEKYRFLKG